VPAINLPLQARRHHVDRWIAEQVEHPQPGTGRPVVAATIARRLSGLAGPYECAVIDVGLIDASPVLRVKRLGCPSGPAPPGSPRQSSSPCSDRPKPTAPGTPR
jgi:hypothetical protein